MTAHSSLRPARTYKVNSLDRGLDVLRAIRNADGPMRNNDIVIQTGLPKATVSRLVHTLTVMGYLRRIDQGSYVLGQASGRSGRAMLEGLQLERYASYFENLLTLPGAYACLEIRVDSKMVPVFQWSATSNMLLTSGMDVNAASSDPLISTCADYVRNPGANPRSAADREIHEQLTGSGYCQQWYKESGRLTVCTGVNLASVALCVLALHSPQPDRPTARQLQRVGNDCLRAANAIASESPDK